MTGLLAFTLPNLVHVLGEAGLCVVTSSDDIHPEITAASAFVGSPIDPHFFARVEGAGELLDLSSKVIDAVWAAFGRGPMEFCGWCDEDGKPIIVVKEIEAKP